MLITIPFFIFPSVYKFLIYRYSNIFKYYYISDASQRFLFFIGILILEQFNNNCYNLFFYIFDFVIFI